MFKFFEKRRKRLIAEITNSVVDRLYSDRGWHEFLPPVVVRDAMYMVTKDGAIYRMNCDGTGFEIITEIRSRL